jgi:lipoprotein NlpI
MKVFVAATLRLVVVCIAASLVPAMAQQATEAPAVKEIALAADRFVKGSAVPSWVDPIRTLPASELKAPVVQFLLDTQLLAADEPATYVHRALVATTPIVLDQVSRFQIQFNPAYEHVELHALRIRRGAESLDRLAASKISFLQREVGLDSAVYTGDVTASIIIPDVRVGDTLEFEYTVHGENPVLGKRFAHVVSWDQRWTTEQRRVTLLVPPGRQVNWRFEGGATQVDQQPAEDSAGAFRRLRWQASKIAQFEIDPGIPSSFYPARLRFSEFRDWRDVATWADQLFASANGETPELAQLIAKFKEKPTADERVSAALAWVQSEIRYVSLSLGESSHRPAPAPVTLERRYGDCKDKSALLVQMLRGMGFKAHPVLISATEVRGKARQLPSPYVFDHAIVQVEVDGITYHLDPTRMGQSGRLSALGQRWDSAEVLVVDSATTELSKVASEKTAVSADRLDERLRIGAFGRPGELSIRRTWTGVHAEMARVAFAQISNDRLQKALLEAYERRVPGFELTRPVRLEDDKQNNVLTASIEMRVPAPAANSADRWVVHYEASNIHGVLQLPASSSRTQPFGLPFKTNYSYALQIEFPKEVVVNTDPVRNEFRAPGFWVTRNATFRDNKASTRLDIGLTEPEIEAKQIAAYASAVRWLRTAERNDWWVAKSRLAKAGVSVQARYEAQVAAQLERSSQSIEAGQLAGEDLANAYCQRGRALMYQGQMDKALEDVEHAAKISPVSSAVQLCRGNVLSHAEAPKEAIAAFSTAIALDPKNADAYFQRGVARFHAQEMQLAAADFTESMKQGMRNKFFAQLWHAFALRRMGAELDEKLKAHFAANPRGIWPVPAIAMMFDLITPDDVLALVNTKSGNDRDLTLAEAYFAIAQWHYAKGDKAQAAEYFRKTLGQGAILYYEHEAARLELKALEAAR